MNITEVVGSDEEFLGCKDEDVGDEVLFQ